MDITLCLIVKNEEQNLDRCLSSFKPLYNRLVVVDTGSTDSTKEIAAKHGADIYDFKWIDDFGTARNFALSKAKTDWLMMVDADDAMDETTISALKEKLDALGDEVDGIFLPYNLHGKNTEKALTAYIPRIWKRSLNLKYDLMVHEYLHPTPEQLKRFIRLDFPIEHQKSIPDFVKSHARNLKILYKAIEKHPSERRYYFYLGHDNQFDGNTEEAIKWYKKYAELPDTNPHELNRVLTNLGNCLLKTGKVGEAKKAYLDAIKVCPDFIEPHLALGNLYKAVGDFETAASFYIKAANCIPPKTHVFINTALYKGAAQKKLAAMLEEIKTKK